MPDRLEDWRRSHFSREITPELDGRPVTIFGWVSGIRDLGGIKFLLLGDRTGEVQVTIPVKAAEEHLLRKVEKIKKEYIVGVKGVARKSGKAQRGVEVFPREIKILNVAKHPLPLDPTGRVPAEIDVRLNARILDLRRPETRAVFVVYHHVTNAIRSYLTASGFMEVHTPRIIATATEGGASLFPIVYFEREAFLAQSPQLYKEQLTAAFEKVYEIGNFFRAEESHTTRHVSEFISVDVEQAYADLEDVMRVLEGLTSHVVDTVNRMCEEELKILNLELKPPKLPLRRYTYDHILGELKEMHIDVPWGEDIPTQALRALGESHAGEYYFIIDWPTRTKSFYIKPRDGRPEISEGFDFMHGWMELASGGTRIHEKELLIRRLKEQGLKPESFEYHLKVFEYGMPPHAGWGLGLNRLVMVLTGRDNIRECILFPRDRFRLTP